MDKIATWALVSAFKLHNFWKSNILPRTVPSIFFLISTPWVITQGQKIQYKKIPSKMQFWSYSSIWICQVWTFVIQKYLLLERTAFIKILLKTVNDIGHDMTIYAHKCSLGSITPSKCIDERCQPQRLSWAVSAFVKFLSPKVKAQNHDMTEYWQVLFRIHNPSK